jgi:hypothetical protein
MRLTPFVFGLLLASPLGAQEQAGSAPPPPVQKVLDHLLERDYPEVYSGKHYRVRVRGWAVGDMKGDGRTQVFLLLDPHYQQTAPIQIFQLSPDGRVQRLREALAPGPLVPFNLERIDPHTLGTAIDLTGIEGKTADAPRRFAVELSKEMNVVYYRGFVHSDKPDRVSGSGYQFVDVSDREEFKGADKCLEIQFSQPEVLAIGKIQGAGESLYLAVSVAPEVYLYRITRITEEGLLEKQITRLPLPKDAIGLECSKAGFLSFRIQGLRSEERLQVLPKP